MTTTVKVTAHVWKDKEVLVLVGDKVERVLQDGETCEVYAYDDRVISVKEVEKTKEQEC